MKGAYKLKKFLGILVSIMFYLSILPPLSGGVNLYHSYRMHNITSDNGVISGFDNISARRIGDPSFTDNGYFKDIIFSQGVLDNTYKLPSPYVDVRAWEMVADDNTAAAANRAAWNSNITSGKKILIPPGRFDSDNTLTYPSNIEIAGQGMGVSIIRGIAEVRTMLLRNADTTNGNDNIYIHDLTLEQLYLPAEAEAGNWHDWFTCRGAGGNDNQACRNIRVERVEFRTPAITAAGDGHKALMFWGAQGTFTAGCKFWGDIGSVVTYASAGVITDLDSLFIGNQIYTRGAGTPGELAKSVIVGSGSGVKIIANDYADNTSTSPQFIEVGDADMDGWISAFNNVRIKNGSFLIALASQNFRSFMDFCEGTDNVAGHRCMINFNASVNGANRHTNIQIIRPRLINGAVVIQTSDNTGVIDGALIDGAEIDGTISESGAISIESTGTKKNIRVLNSKVRGAGKSGVSLSGPFTYLTVANVESWNNGLAEDGIYQDGFSMFDISGGPFFFTDNFAGDNTASPKQLYGFHFATGSPNIDQFSRNKARGNATNPFRSIDGATFSEKTGNKWTSGLSRGTASLASGTVTVNTDEVVGGDTTYVSVTRTSVVGTPGHLTTESISGGSFVVNSTSATDNSAIVWTVDH